MKRIFIGSIILLTLITASCKKSSNNSNNNIPSNCTNTTGWIAGGHKWVYTNEPLYIFADSLFVDLVDMGSGVFKVNDTYDDGSIYAPFSSYVKPCGTDVYQSASSSMSNATITYKNPVSVNDTWTINSQSTGGYSVTSTMKVIANGVSVDVPAGTFTCTKFHLTSNSTQPGSITVETDIYYNNAVGMVETDGNTSHYELVRKNF